MDDNSIQPNNGNFLRIVRSGEDPGPSDEPSASDIFSTNSKLSQEELRKNGVLLHEAPVQENSYKDLITTAKSKRSSGQSFKLSSEERELLSRLELGQTESGDDIAIISEETVVAPDLFNGDPFKIMAIIDRLRRDYNACNIELGAVDQHFFLKQPEDSNESSLRWSFANKVPLPGDMSFPDEVKREDFLMSTDAALELLQRKSDDPLLRYSLQKNGGTIHNYESFLTRMSEKFDATGNIMIEDPIDSNEIGYPNISSLELEQFLSTVRKSRAENKSATKALVTKYINKAPVMTVLKNLLKDSEFKFCPYEKPDQNGQIGIIKFKPSGTDPIVYNVDRFALIAEQLLRRLPIIFGVQYSPTSF